MKKQGFLKAHRLFSKKDIEILFSRGNSCAEFPLRFIWNIQKSEETQFCLAISIPKKRFAHAVDRNLLKRRIREGFRILYTQQNISSICELKHINLMIVYIDNTKRSQQEIQEKIERGLKKILAHAQNI